MTKLILTDMDEVLLDWGGHFEEWYLKTAPTFAGAPPKGKLRDDLNVQKNAVLEIASGLRNHALCADAEINLAAVIIKLSEL